MAEAVPSRPHSVRRGFSLIEISIALVMIGVLAAFGVPRLLQSVERNKASEAFKFLGQVQLAQDRSLQQRGRFASELSQLDTQFDAPQYFAVGAIHPGDSGSLKDSWTLTLTRVGSSSGYGTYTVTFTQTGYDSANSTIDSEINPQSG